jgi:peptide/nickel transport system permease protein
MTQTIALTAQQIKRLERESRRENLGRSWYKFSRNPMSVVGLVMVVALVLLAIFAPVVTPYPRHAGPFTDFPHAKLMPNLQHLFGTDQIGRDILTRIIFGLRSSLLMGVMVLVIVVPPGVLLGLVAGYFVTAAEVTGASTAHILFREILPNTVSPILTKMSLDIAWVIIIGAMLSFVGLGVQPPEPSLGTMVSDGARYLPDQWWIAIFPALAIVVVVLGFNLLGDGVRDMFAAEEV